MKIGFEDQWATPLPGDIDELRERWVIDSDGKPLFPVQSWWVIGPDGEVLGKLRPKWGPEEVALLFE